MGNTPRPNKFSVPMMTRSTDVSLLEQCEGRFWLDLLYDEQAPDASFFELGSALHEGIEFAIINDSDLHSTLLFVQARLTKWVESIQGRRVIEASQRTVATIHDDAKRMLANWFKFVHPEGEKRHPLYDEYQWPPKVEVPFLRTPESADTKYSVWGSIDAVFWAKDFSHHRFVDWKSGSKKQGNSHQLHHYIFGFNADTRVEGNYHHLDKVQKPSIVQEMEPYPGDDVVRDRILKTERKKEQVLKGRAPVFTPDWYCNYCPVQEFCPAEGDWRNRLANQKKLDALLPLTKPFTQF